MPSRFVLPTLSAMPHNERPKRWAKRHRPATFGLMGALMLGLSGCGDPYGWMDSFFDLQDQVYDCQSEDEPDCNYMHGATPENLPVSGSAAYEGAVVLWAEDLASGEEIGGLMGGLSVDVVFDTQGGDMSGTAERFHKTDGSGDLVGGTLELTNTVLDRSGTLYAGEIFGTHRSDLSVVGNIDGDLEIDGETLAVDAALGGYVYGDNGELIDADVLGTGLLGEAQTAYDVYGQIYLKAEE